MYMDRIGSMVWASRNAHNETIGCANAIRGRYYTKICVGQGGILGLADDGNVGYMGPGKKTRFNVQFQGRL